jgi:DNA polymerase-3 subunit alpha
MESLAYAGGFDCFPEHHRAQYFFVPVDETSNGLERIIKFGQIITAQNATSTNTLFGDLPMSMEIPAPKLPDCPHWSLIEQLTFEKEVTGMFLSGHPLDHYKFEMRHYGVTPIVELVEFRDSFKLQSNTGRTFRIIGLIAEAQHKIAKSGNKYGNFVIEDYSGKTEFVLFSEDYLKFSPYLQQGSTVLINGYFKQRYNRDEVEFKLNSVSLAETMKKSLTKQVCIGINPQDITTEMIGFMEKNVQRNPGSASLKFLLIEPKTNSRLNLVSGKGFEMNEEMIRFLEGSPELEVQVTV